jgi:hypothetical protein
MKQKKIDLSSLKEEYKKGVNITQLLNKGQNKNSKISIEIAYPMISGIPILKSSHAIVASHYNSVNINWQ